MSTGPLLELPLDPKQPLGLQVERRIRDLVRAQTLPVGTTLPSTRALAEDLGVSRGVVVGAYAQLAAEGYLTLRRGAAPSVAATAHAPTPCVQDESDVPIARWRYNLRPDLPDLGLFPREQWLAASREALRRAANTDLAYGEPYGAVALRNQLAPFLARTRGVVADASRIGIFAGSTHALVALASTIDGRIGVEDPGHRWRTRVLNASGKDIVAIPVDDHGLRVDALDGVAAVVVSPDHHFPTGVALAPDRRRALVEWATRNDALIVEHDYDGHFRYDRPPAGALQAMAPEHVAYVGSASALLAPTLRLGWAVLPQRFVDPVAMHLFANVVAVPRLSQLALAELIASGQLDRHLRRARTAYKRRRELVNGNGVPVGLYVHVPVEDEEATLERLRAKGIAVDGVNEHALTAQPPGLVVGFAAVSEPTLRRALKQLP